MDDSKAANNFRDHKNYFVQLSSFRLGAVAMPLPPLAGDKRH